MSAYDLNQLLRLWTADKLTAEQAIGQIIQQIQALSERVNELERKMEQGSQSRPPSPPKR
jgi:hypothetical protein